MYESVSRLKMVELIGASDRDATIRIAESNDPRTVQTSGIPGDYNVYSA